MRKSRDEEELDKLKKELQKVDDQLKLMDQECAYCHKDGCDVISFRLKKPVHSWCHALAEQDN